MESEFSQLVKAVSDLTDNVKSLSANTQKQESSSKILSEFKDKFNFSKLDISKPIKNIGSKISDSVTTPFKSLKNSITTPFKAVKESISDIKLPSFGFGKNNKVFDDIKSGILSVEKSVDANLERVVDSIKELNKSIVGNDAAKVEEQREQKDLFENINNNLKAIADKDTTVEVKADEGKGGLVAFLSSVVSSLSLAFGGLTKPLISFKKALKNTKIGRFLRKLRVAFKRSGIGKFLSRFGKTLRTSGIGKTFSGLGKTAGRLVKGLARFGKLLGKLAIPLTIIIGLVAAIKGALKGFQEGGITEAIKQALMSVVDVLVFDLITIIGDSIGWIFKKLGFEALGESFSNLINSIVDVMKKTFGGLIDMIIGIFTLDFDRFKKGFEGYLSAIGDTIKLLFTNLPEVFMNLLKASFDILGKSINILLVKLPQFIFDVLISAVSFLKDALIGFFQKIPEFLTDALKYFTEELPGKLSGSLKSLLGSLLPKGDKPKSLGYFASRLIPNSVYEYAGITKAGDIIEDEQKVIDETKTDRGQMQEKLQELEATDPARAEELRKAQREFFEIQQQYFEAQKTGIYTSKKEREEIERLEAEMREAAKKRDELSGIERAPVEKSASAMPSEWSRESTGSGVKLLEPIQMEKTTGSELSQASLNNRMEMEANRNASVIIAGSLGSKQSAPAPSGGNTTVTNYSQTNHIDETMQNVVYANRF